MAQDGRCRPQGRAGADATLTGIDDGGHLPAVCTGVSAAGGEFFDGTAYERSDSVNYWSHFGAIGDFRGLQVIDFVVPGARIELATPAFSGRRSTGELPRHTVYLV